PWRYATPRCGCPRTDPPEPSRVGAVMVLMRRGIIGSILLTIVLFSCDAVVTRAAPSPTVSPSTAVSPSREPAALPRYPEEQAVLDVLTASGMRVELVGAS